MNKQEQIEQKVTQELGYVSALFMTQECKGTEIVMPTKELKEVAYAISLYFSSLIHQAITEERERMREKANKLRKDHSFKVHEVGDIAKEAYNQALDDLLLSLDKPTDK